jgi:hypothetical protein
VKTIPHLETGVGNEYFNFQPSQRREQCAIKIIHFELANPPLI